MSKASELVDTNIVIIHLPYLMMRNIDRHDKKTKHPLNEIVLELTEARATLVTDLRMTVTTLAQQFLQLFV